MCTRKLNSCQSPSDFDLLERGLRLFFSIVATHLLAGEVDTTLSDFGIFGKISWLARYYNPVNLTWRYYSILAYRFVAKSWGEKQVSLVNFEGYPQRSPIPFLLGERIEDYCVKRLEISGLFSSQGLMSCIAAWQGIVAIQFVFSREPTCYLPTMTKPLALLGLFRVMVSKWVASRVYVEPFQYPSSTMLSAGFFDHKHKNARIASFVGFGLLVGILFLTVWPFFSYAHFDFRHHYVEFSMDYFYLYMVISIVLIHTLQLWRGPLSFGNRISLFDHWTYKLQTLGFFVVSIGAVSSGIVDFVTNNYYRSCA